jgi:hypothetical protein
MIIIIASLILSVFITSYWYDHAEFKKEIKRRGLYYQQYGRKPKKASSFKTK